MQNGTNDSGKSERQHKVEAREFCSIIRFQVYLMLGSHLISSSHRGGGDTASEAESQVKELGF